MQQNISLTAFSHVTHVLWDWNGTLLNDRDICVDIINELLQKRGNEILTKEKYQHIFTFPVKDYYEAAGFNFQEVPFEEVAVEFMDLYREKIPSADIFPEVLKVLKVFQERGYKQYIISAMEHEFLVQTLKDKKLIDYFAGISGINNDLANGKTDMALRFVNEMKIEPARAVFIGDTLHDMEVATAIGTSCLLVAAGHQSYERLSTNGNLVVESLNGILQFFN